MAAAIGKKRWVIPEGYIPPDDREKPRQFISHEAACILNTGDDDAHIQITLYFGDRDPCGPYPVTVPARRTLHLRFNDLLDPRPVPVGTDYSSVLESDLPIVVQYTRLDSRRSDIALLSTIAFASD